LEGRCHRAEGLAVSSGSVNSSTRERASGASTSSKFARVVSDERTPADAEDRAFASPSFGMSSERREWRCPRPSSHVLFTTHDARRSGKSYPGTRWAQRHLDTQRYMHLSPAAVEGAVRLLEQPSPVSSFGDTWTRRSTNKPRCMTRILNWWTRTPKIRTGEGRLSQGGEDRIPG
jgi:hypothetical protein